MDNEVNDKALLEKAEDATPEAEEATVDEVEEIDVDETVDVFEVTDDDETETPAEEKDDTWVKMVIIGIVMLTIAVMAAVIFTSEERTKQLNTLLSKVSELEETVTMLQEAEDKDVIKSYKGVLEGVRTVTEKGKTKYYVTISCAGEFEVSPNIYGEVQRYVGCILNWYEHTTFDEEGAKVIWYNYDIESVG